MPHPSRALYFLLPKLPTPLSTWCCQNPCGPSSCTTSTPGPHRIKPKSTREASGANLSGRPYAGVEIKPQLKPRGSVAEERDSKPSHQLHKLHLKSTQSTRQSSHKRKHITSDSCGHWRQEHTRTRLESELPRQQVQRPAQCWRASLGR